jgi:8-oxo-dGTP pyrophosphatase MutT (NUDIX family)
MSPSVEQIYELLRAAGETTASGSDAPAEIEGIGSAGLKCAAVLVPLLLHDSEWHVLLTRRTTRVESHKGQVSFPGGACDPGEETPEETALREASEELGIREADVRVLGRLASLITVTDYRVTPVVGVLAWPCVFHVQTAEVARVFTMPLEWLANASNRWELAVPATGRSVYVFHPYDSELLWGATAQIAVDLVSTLRLGASQ